MTHATVRDRLFFLAHDEDRNLAPHVHPALLDYALAGATIIDLLLHDWIRDLLYEISPTMYDRTQAALIATGTIREHRRRFRRTGHRLNDPHAVGAPRAALRSLVLATSARRNFTRRPGTDALAALVNAVHLYPPLYLDFSDAEIRGLLNLNTRGIATRARPGAAAHAIPYIAGCVEDAVAAHTVAVYP
ncbi:GPP34 family phosphoprotein [Catenuloplanes japonicus]|uniref:GPP34 family phosphoprotein n=1 Tax=Catenuloplanes japonicus TaxID=33876 RepID=UPI0005255CF7|nr:GPP34 family phosphoprotein [Catenuloplanes japonicus]